jgi:hypothetical protein
MMVGDVATTRMAVRNNEVKDNARYAYDNDNDNDGALCARCGDDDPHYPCHTLDIQTCSLSA